MRIIETDQGSESWMELRSVRPTASCFHKFVTPVDGKYSTQATKYAFEIVSNRMKLEKIERLPTAWEDRGTELEPSARLAYEKQFGVKVTTVGFVLPDYTDLFGGSPDGLVNVTARDDKHHDAEGVVEFKCVKAETLMGMHLNGSAEMYAKPQLQGLLLVTQCQWIDIFIFHPELEPFYERVLPDVDYQQKIADNMHKFLAEIEYISSRIKRQKHEIVPAESCGSTDLKWD